MYSYRPSATIDRQSKNWVKFADVIAWATIGSRTVAFYLTFMELVVNLRACYLAKLKVINIYKVLQICLKIHFIQKKIKSGQNYGHVMVCLAKI